MEFANEPTCWAYAQEVKTMKTLCDYSAHKESPVTILKTANKILPKSV